MITLYLSDSNVNIENYVDMSTFSIQSRCDEAFATGSFKAYLPLSLNGLLKYNVAPYTKIVITGINGLDVTTWLCCSECHKHLVEDGLYVHDFTLIEATSILSGFILGTKNFSITGTNTKDSDKVKIIMELMANKYGYTINGFNYSLFNNEIEYSFGAGTTMYDALTEIAKHYNYKVYVSSLTSTSLSIIFKSLAQGSTSVSSSKILSVTYSQNSDEYGLTLETEASNVVDRTTVTEEDYITCRADDILLNNDTAKVYLSNNIEQLKDFGIHVGNFDDGTSDTHYLLCLKLKFYISSDIETLVNNATYRGCQWGDLADYLLENDYYLNDIYDKYFADIVPNYDEFSTCWLQLNYTTPGAMYYEIQTWTRRYNDEEYSSTEFHTPTKFSLMHKTLEENEFNLLTTKEQTGYACYKSGSNYIQNLNAEYKADLWNKIIGETQTGLLYSSTKMASDVTIDDVDIDGFGQLEYSFTAGGYNTPNLQTVAFYAKYIPITDIFVKDDKTDTPVNETAYKPLGRSYNENASFVDFDKLITNISVSNSTMGRPELQIELDSVCILASRYFTYDDVTWYVSSSITGYKNDAFVTTLNLVRNYSKVAECIGVETQYNSTKNPYSGIVERPIFVEGTTSSAITGNAFYFIFQFMDANGNKITKTNNGTSYYKYIVRAAYQVKDNVAYFYAPMADEYSIGTARVKSATNAELTDVPYVDSNNECKYVSISLIAGSAVTFTAASSNLMPCFSGTVSAIAVKSNVPIYKDAREKLTFTYKIKLT